MGHQITLTLSDSLDKTLCDWAKARKKSVKQIAIETLQAATLSEDAERPALIDLFLVVDRRVVVDQSTDEAERVIHKLQDSLCSPESSSVLKTVERRWKDCRQVAPRRI
jgi:hypothetical protein